MKKFLIKFSVYILLLSIFTVGINVLYIERSNVDDIGAFSQGVPDDIQICNFGSSHGLYSFNYEDVGQEYTCFNFALSGQLLMYDYRILQNIKDKIHKNSIAFIVLSYFSFLGKSETERENFLSLNRRYYKFLPPELIKNYDAKTNFYVKYFPVLLVGDLFYLITVPSVENVWLKTTTAQEAEKDAQVAYTRHLVTDKFDENGMRIYSKEAFDSLYGMINLLKGIGATPILITTPFTR